MADSTTSTIEEDRRTSSPRVVHVVPTKASILSGGSSLEDCLSPDDDTCIGGIAAADAYRRYLTKTTTATTTEEPSLLVPWVVSDTKFIYLNEVGLGANLIIPFVFELNFFLAPPTFITQSLNAQADLYTGMFFMMYEKFPLLLSNAALPPTNDWSNYMKAVHFDDATNLAVMHIAREDHSAGTDQVGTAIRLLAYIARVNANNGCGDALSIVFELNLTDTAGMVCWVPVILFDSKGKEDSFDTFLKGLVGDGTTENYNPVGHNPVGLVVDVNGMSMDKYGTPKQINSNNSNNNNAWVVSFPLTRESYFQLKLTVGDDRISLQNVELINQDLASLPESAKDETYRRHIEELREVVKDLMVDDPVVGSTGDMPAPVADDGYQPCLAGECAVGNLFTDAIRWFKQTDVAFLPGVLFKGPGWPAGQVLATDLWEAMPFTYNICNGTMTGRSLFQLLNYSIGEAAFDGVFARSADELTLLQVSGMQITYNSDLQESRILSIDVWDKDAETYRPLNRSQLYSFATDSYLCTVMDPFPSLVSGSLNPANGEVRPKEDYHIDSSAAEAYMRELFQEQQGQQQMPYNTSLQNRLRDDKSLTDVLNFIQSRVDCHPGETFWDSITSYCVECPLYANVAVEVEVEGALSPQLSGSSNATTALEGVSGSNLKPSGRLVLINQESFGVLLRAQKSSIPSWVDSGWEVDQAVPLEANATSGLDFSIDLTVLDAGTARSTLSFDIHSDGGNHTDCKGALSLEVLVKVTPSPSLNQLGYARIFGFVGAAIILLTAICFAALIRIKRKVRVVMAMQPTFLLAICFGIVVVGMTTIPISIDDEIASQRGCDIACMSYPWLLSLGSTLTCGALFSKLWRINKLFGQGFRRIQVRERDVLLPFVMMFFLNVMFLIIWTAVDPLRYRRFPVDGENWKTYGTCVFTGAVSKAMVSLILVLLFVCLGLACYQAFKARNLSSEFSESKYLGIALFSCVQLLLVGVPVYLLISNENTIAKYSLAVALILAICMSVLVLVFVPIFISMADNKPRAMVHVSGMDSKVNSGSHNSQSGVGGCIHHSKADGPNIGESGGSQPPNIRSTSLDQTEKGQQCIQEEEGEEEEVTKPR